MQQRVPFRALVVAAHPDDIEFSCAGTVAQWTQRGADVTYCIVTDGSTGTQDRSLMGRGLADVRREESQRAAEVVGVSTIEWLGYRDGYVEYTLDLRRDIARAFRKFKPHRYLVLEPAATIEDRFVNHPDHRAVGHASLDVSMTAGTTPGHYPELLEEGFDPWRGLRELWVMGPGNKPHLVDISATIDKKIESLLCHRSQVGEDADQVETFVRRFCAELGEPAGYDYAESFNVIRQGPGFHAGEQDDDVDLGDIVETPSDPRSAPPTS